MSYEAYKGFIATMMVVELREEVIRLEGALAQSKTDKSREAWRRMLTSARNQERRNGA